MGSLMAGWDSPVLRSKPGDYVCKRNQSLTKEEIEDYWKAHKKSNSISQEISTVDESGRKFQKSSSFPVTGTKGGKDSETSLGAQKIMNSNGWWTVSNWAFLNEPPILEGDSNSNSTYASQFHVANSWAPKSNGHDQIST